MTMSASFSASALTVAPAAVNSESGRPDLMPAPGSTAISTPNALYFFTVSGETATRGSDGSISLATAIFMGPPAARGTRTSKLALFPLGWIPVLQPACGQIFRPRRGVATRRYQSGQEDRHHRDDEDHRGRAVFHQLDKTFIGLLMGNVIVAIGGGVGDFVMLRHRGPQSVLKVSVGARAEIAQSGSQGNAG